MNSFMAHALTDNTLTVKHLVSLLIFSLLLLATAANVSAVTPWYTSVGTHIVVLKPDGTVWAVGNNNCGQLGIGSTGGESLEPVKVQGLSEISAVAAGGSHSVALRKDGSVWTWGHNGSGQLGNGIKAGSSTPSQVPGLRDVVAIAAGYSHVAALKKDGTVWAWGSNHSGQLGKSSFGTSMTPVRVSELTGVSAIAAGAFHTAALKNDGSVWTWGYNGSGQLGNGTRESNYQPEKVAAIKSVTAITAGNNHMVALRSDGTAWVWGSNYASQLGNGSTSDGSTLPVQVSGLSGVMDVSAKVNHTYALMQNGTVMAWGDKGSGQWGNGITMNGSATPVQMRGVSSVTTVAAVGDPGTLARSDGTAVAGGAGNGKVPEAVADINATPYADVMITAAATMINR